MSTDVIALLKRRDRLREFFRQYWHCTFDGESLLALSAKLRNFLPGASLDAIFESMRQYVGKELSRADFDSLAWLLAGNLDRLKRGLAISEWRAQQYDEWVPVQVLRVFKATDNYGQRVYGLSLLCLAGTPCGKVFDSYRKPSFLFALSRKIGFTARRGSLPYLDARQYMSLRFVVKIIATKSQQNIVFDELDSTSGTTKWNKELLKVRHRLIPCPQGFNHRCHHCIVGTDHCGAATHKLTYRQAACEFCGEEEAWFDPETSTVKCLHCVEKEAWR